MAQPLRKIFKELSEDYPQTWHFVSGRGKRITKVIQWICKIITKHPLSETEWSYEGGEYANRWCRWCNKKIRVPKDSIRFEFKDTAWLMDDVEKEGVYVTRRGY